MLKVLKHTVGLRALKRMNHKKRHAVVTNYHDANNVGAIYFAKSESDFILVKQFIKFLKSEYGIRNARAFAYIDAMDVPGYFLRGTDQDWITQKDLAWNSKPMGESYNKFVTEPLDILIDLTDGDCLPLLFAQKESTANFKVGKSGAGNEDQFDMLVQVNDDDTFDKYLHKVNHFLKVINQPKKAYEHA
ncbi:MAG: hypothetical protein ACI8XB_000378 [Patiriisocius sp.]